jgi:hypothetical protein
MGKVQFLIAVLSSVYNYHKSLTAKVITPLRCRLCISSTRPFSPARLQHSVIVQRTTI